ncbi:MAG: leucine-rich repeat domain-containing protein [Clostridia bacterium]|nr:leucine-rich repeat domain-containing protein [Clostridia bacterium]
MRRAARRPGILTAGILLGLLLAACARPAEPEATPAASPTPLPVVQIAGRRFDAAARTIDLAGCAPAPDELTAGLSMLPALEQANLRGCPLSDAEKRALQTAFPDVAFGWTVSFCEIVTADSADTLLCLDGLPVEDGDALREKLSLLPALERVEMRGCGLSDEEMAALAEAFPAIRFVWLVRVACFELSTDARAFSMGQRRDTEGVRVVGEMYYHRVTNEDIAPLRYCVDLEALDLGHAKNVTDISCLAGLTKLRYLVIAIMSLESVEALRGLTELVYLECFNNQISDISPLAELKALRYLNCGMNPFTDASPLMELEGLERLWINRASIRREDGEALKAALPDTQVMCAFGADPSAYGWRKGNQGYINMQAIFGLRALGQ